MAKKDHEYVFDVKLWAEVRVTAASEEEARKKMAEGLRCLSINYDSNGIRIERASIEDSREDELLEVDGGDADEDGECDQDADRASANEAAGRGNKPISEYAFDATVRIAIRVIAATEQDARDLLDQHLDGADANFGAWPNGDPIAAEASLWDRPRVYEIDGEPYQPLLGDDEDCIRRAEDDGAVFERDRETGLWSVASHDGARIAAGATSRGEAARLYCVEMRILKRSGKLNASKFFASGDYAATARHPRSPAG